MIPESQKGWTGPRSANSAKISEQKRAKPGHPQPLPAASEMTPASSPSSRSHVERYSQGWGQRLILPCLGMSWSPQHLTHCWHLLSQLVYPLPTEETTLLSLG